MTARYLRIKVYLCVAHYSLRGTSPRKGEKIDSLEHWCRRHRRRGGGGELLFLGEEQIKRPGNNGVSPSFLLVAGPLALLFALRNLEEELISPAVYRWTFFSFPGICYSWRWSLSINIELLKNSRIILLLIVSCIIIAKLPRYIVIICIEKSCVILWKYFPTILVPLYI